VDEDDWKKMKMGNNDKIDRIDKKDKIDKMELNSALKEYMEAPLKIKGQQ